MIQIGKYQIPKDFFLFLVISVLLGMVTAVDSTSLANRLYEELNFTVMERSLLEAPRELPGLLLVVLFGMLNGLGDIRIAAVANIIGGVGLLFFGVTPGNFALILTFLVLYSTGMHLYLPLASTMAMSFATGSNYGRRIGEVQSVGNLSVILTAGVLYLLYRITNISYMAVFTFAGVAMILAGILFLFLRSEHKLVSEKRFVFRKEYKVYYLAAIVNGARKQITLTFAPWLIIDIFQQPVTTITMLFLTVCLINIFFRPWYGSLIDTRGEQFALRLEAIILFIACLGFTFAKTLFSLKVALIIVSVSYILDKMMDVASNARATYVRRLSNDPAEISRTLSMGLSMDHAVSMTIPILAGYIWYANGATGYMYVFASGMVISVINFVIASKLDG